MTFYLTKTGKETRSLTQEQLQGSRVEPTLVGDQEISKARHLGKKHLAPLAPLTPCNLMLPSANQKMHQSGGSSLVNAI